MNRSEAMKTKWADPEWRERQIAAVNASRDRIAAAQKRNWEDPEFRERMSRVLRRAGGDRRISKQGYVVLRYQHGHPLASHHGELLEHRAVLYAKIGPGSHPCHWCGKLREWGGAGGIHVDHLDEDKLNNDPENLVPSCKQCNGNRGKGVVGGGLRTTTPAG